MASLGTAAPAVRPDSSAQARYYRPEFDALCFFAFFCVLVHHGWELGRPITLVERAGGYGLSTFFVLSAFLITELLLRERERTGAVHIKAFYVRRALRIWPLYFFAIFLAKVIGMLPGHPFWMTRIRTLGYILFIANWITGPNPFIVAPLWSISIEEQFYAVWPTIAKLRGELSIVIASCILIPASILTMALWRGDPADLWRSTFVEFLFFASGALLAIVCRKFDTARYPRSLRLLAAAVGLCAWLMAARTGVGTDFLPAIGKPAVFAGYLLADLGCILIMLAVIGVSSVPGWLRYLGKISYGLYVFHGPAILFWRWVWSKTMPGRANTLFVDTASLALCIGVAALSYHFLESPFLRLKERFAFVRSRPA